MTTQTNPFITANWRPEHCDPNNWGYKPSTYDVEGVELIGTPHMMLFTDMTGTWVNPARAERINLSKLKDLRDNIHEFGINTKEGRMIYVDADDMSTINGNHRKDFAQWSSLVADELEKEIKFGINIDITQTPLMLSDQFDIIINSEALASLSGNYKIVVCIALKIYPGRTSVN